MNERLIEWRTYGVTMIEPLTISIAVILQYPKIPKPPQDTSRRLGCCR